METEAVLAFVRSWISEHGYSPSTREIVAGLDVSSTRIVHEALVELRDAGKVDWVPGQARTLRVVDGVIRSDASQ